MSAPQETTRSMATNIVIGVVVLIGAAWGTSFWWLPPLGGSADDEAEKAADASETLTMLELSDEALATLNIEVQPLKRTPYERTISVPGRTAVVPGVGRREVTSPTSGVVAGIFVREGEIVQPGQPLFELKLVHDEGIKVQVELLDALADREVVDADLERLQALEKTNPGVIQGTRILEKIYRRQHLNHLIASRRQMLILLGLPTADVDSLIDSHLGHEDIPSTEDHKDLRKSPLLEKVVIAAPSVNKSSDASEPYLVEKLDVVQGQHVESGDVLCQLGDYRQLYIVGEAFERDSESIRQARDKGWPVSVVIERRGGDPSVLRDLRITDIAPQVNADARTAGFYVLLDNTMREVSAVNGQPARRDWVYRPGRRLEIRVPTERIHNALKVPVTAVAQDGLDNYVFQANGNVFNRRRVKVLHRDEDYVVLAESRMLTDGVPIAMNGAYQLQLALLNASMDPAAVAHGHAH